MNAEILLPREVPLGGQRAMMVRRTLPHRDIRMIGAFCFVDHYGDPRSTSHGAGPMVVPPHPHMGLQTVSWLLEGTIDHLDSVGSIQRVRPGELNLMTAGAGIAHSEYSVADGNVATSLHGLQIWVALPDADRHQEPHFEHHGDLPLVTDGGLVSTVILGTFMGETSKASIYSPVTCAEISAPAGRHVLPVASNQEHGLLALENDIRVDSEPLPRGSLRYQPPGQVDLTFETPSDTRVLLIGGAPFGEDLLMWWNFVGRTHDEMVEARDAWVSGERFGSVVDDPNPPLLAPEIPQVRMKPRPPQRL